MGLLNILRRRRKQKGKNVGYLLVIEGTDGSGKATQLDKLVEDLEEEGHQNIKTVDFPQYKNWSGKLAKWYLNDKFGDADSLNPYLGSIPLCI